MSNKDYVGYTLFDKVIIVAKNIVEEYKWEDNQCHAVFGNRWQGYVVDPSNKSMLQSALNWGVQYKSIYENGKYVGREEIQPQQFEFENKGWKMEILKVADGSSQGGKLSFWTCLLTKGDQSFEIGINADLLLDVLKAHTFTKGKCEADLMFARCKGGVGVLSEDMEEYKQALADMQKKKDVKTKKTSKHVIGHAYTALREVQAYVGDLYAWYEPIVEMRRSGSGWTSRDYETVVGFRKLEAPVKLKWFPTLYNYTPGKTEKLSAGTHFGIDHWNMKDKLPARIDAGPAIEYDISLEEAVDKYYWQPMIRDLTGTYKRGFSREEMHFYSVSSTEFSIPEEVRALLLAEGYKIED